MDILIAYLYECRASPGKHIPRDHKAISSRYDRYEFTPSSHVVRA